MQGLPIEPEIPKGDKIVDLQKRGRPSDDGGFKLNDDNLLNLAFSDDIKRAIDDRSSDFTKIANVVFKIEDNWLNSSFFDDIKQVTEECPLEWRNFLGHTLPSKEGIETITKFLGPSSIVLSVGCGPALWEYLLSRMGVNVVATDIRRWSTTFMTVLELDAQDAIKEYPHASALMLVWPLSDVFYDFQALSSYTGNKVILISDLDNKDVGSKPFFDLLDQEWTVADYVLLPPFEGIMKFQPVLRTYRRNNREILSRQSF